MWPRGDQPGPSHSGSQTSFLAAGLPEQALNYLSSVQSLTPRVGNTLHACMKMPEENLLFYTHMLENSIKFNKEKTFLIILSLDIFLLVFLGGGKLKVSRMFLVTTGCLGSIGQIGGFSCLPTFLCSAPLLVPLFEEGKEMQICISGHCCRTSQGNVESIVTDQLQR